MTLMKQLDLFSSVRLSLDEQFARFLEEQPDVYPLFVRLASELRAKGYTRYSADAICHRIRWHFNVDHGDAEFKLNNNHVSRLARKAMAEYECLADFFELRTLKGT